MGHLCPIAVGSHLAQGPAGAIHLQIVDAEKGEIAEGRGGESVESDRGGGGSKKQRSDECALTVLRG